MTPSQFNIEKGTIIPPENGWEPGVYIVELAFNENNVIHRAIMELSFINGNPKSSDKGTICNNYTWIMGSYEEPAHPRDVYCLRAIEKIADRDELYNYPISNHKKEDWRNVT